MAARMTNTISNTCKIEDFVNNVSCFLNNNLEVTKESCSDHPTVKKHTEKQKSKTHVFNEEKAKCKQTTPPHSSSFGDHNNGGINNEMIKHLLEEVEHLKKELHWKNNIIDQLLTAARSGNNNNNPPKCSTPKQNDRLIQNCNFMYDKTVTLMETPTKDVKGDVTKVGKSPKSTILTSNLDQQLQSIREQKKQHYKDNTTLPKLNGPF